MEKTIKTAGKTATESVGVTETQIEKIRGVVLESLEVAA